MATNADRKWLADDEWPRTILFVLTAFLHRKMAADVLEMAGESPGDARMDPEPFCGIDYYYVGKQLTRLSRMRFAIFERSPV